MQVLREHPSRLPGKFRSAAAPAAALRLRLRVPFAGDELRPRGAIREERALVALWFARLADRPAVVDEQVRPHRPVVLRDDLHQILLDLHRVDEVVRQAEPIRDASDVRVYGDADVLVERVAEDDVGGLATDAG